MSKLRHCVGGSAAGSTAVAILPAATLAGHWPQWQHGRACHTSAGALQHCSRQHCTHVPHSIHLQLSVAIWLYWLRARCVWRPRQARPWRQCPVATLDCLTPAPVTPRQLVSPAFTPASPHRTRTRTEDELLNSGNMKLRKNDL